MKLCVTGGMGFIGSNFIRRIRVRYPEYRIVNVDALTYAGNPQNLADIAAEEEREPQGRYAFVQGDIADVEFVTRVLGVEKPDAIVNFAAESHVDRSFVGAGDFIRTNILGVEHILQYVRQTGTKFVQVSTDEVYGDVPDGFSSEESPLRPSNPYAASKAGADLLAQTYIRSHNAPVIIVRGSNNFGPYQYPEKLIPLSITNVIEGKKIPIHGDGAHVRTWIHVEDFVDGIDTVLHKAKTGTIYNVSGEESSNLELVTEIAKALGKPLGEVTEHVKDRPGADRRYAPSSAKIQKEFGWSPKRSLAEGLPAVIAWYRENRKWWQDIKERREFLDHYEKQRQARYY